MGPALLHTTAHTLCSLQSTVAYGSCLYRLYMIGITLYIEGGTEKLLCIEYSTTVSEKELFLYTKSITNHILTPPAILEEESLLSTTS